MRQKALLVSSLPKSNGDSRKINAMLNVAEMFAQAWKNQQAGNFAGAEGLYRQITQADPSLADGWYCLGIACQALGKAGGGGGAAISAGLANPAGFYRCPAEPGCRARFCKAKPLVGVLADAASARQDEAAAHVDRGVALIGRGKLDEAATAFQQAIRLWPGQANAHNNLGNVYHYQGKYAEALAQFRQAVELDPTLPEPKCNLGNVLMVKGLIDEAIVCYRQALQLRPDYLEAHCNLGNALRSQGKIEEAVVHLQRALAIKPDFAEAHTSLAIAQQDQGNALQSVAHFQEASRLRPSNRLRIMLATRLPVIYQSMEDLQSWRNRLLREVRQLREQNVVLDIRAEPAVHQFYLPYQGLNDRDIQREMAGLFRAPADASALPRATTKGKIKVGFISSYFRQHTIGQWMRGLVANLQRDDFEVIVLSIGNHHDEVADFIRQHADLKGWKCPSICRRPAG